MADETRNIVLKITTDNKAAKANLSDTQKALNANQKALQDLNREYKKGTVATDDYTSAVDGLTKENKDLLNTQTKVQKGQKESVKSVQDLRNRYKQLRETLNSAKVGVNITAKEFDNLKKKTFETQEEIRDFDRSISGSNTLVGEYTRGLEESVAQFRIFGVSVGSITGALSKATKGVEGSTGALRVFKVALASTGIGLLLVALGSLVAFLTKSQKGINFVNKSMATLGAVMDEITDLAISLGESLFETFSNPKQAIMDLGDFILTNIINRFKAISVIGKAIVKIFNDVTDPEGWKDLGNGVVQLNTGIEDSIGKAQEAGKAFGEFYEDTSNQIAEATALEVRRQKLEENRVNFIVREKQLLADVAEARARVENSELTIAERQAANLEAIELTKQLEEERIALKQEELNILVTQNMLSESTLEDKREEKELEAELLNATIEKDKQLKSLLARNKALTAEKEKEGLAAIKVAEDEAKAAQLIVDAKKEAALDLQQFQLEQDIINEENEIIKAEKEIELEQFKQTRLLENETLFEEQKELIRARTQANIDKINAEGAKTYQQQKAKEVEVEKLASQAKLNAATGLISQVQALSEQGSALFKATKVAETIVDTYKGAQAAFSSQAGIPVVGPALAATSFATSLASGFQTVSKILGIKFEKGGELKSGGMFSGNSHANGGIKFRVGGKIHEAEGGEAIINKKSSRMFRSQLSAMNVAGGGKKFASGDVIPSSISSANALPDQTALMENSLKMLPTPLVKVTDINRVQSEGSQVVKVSSL